VHRIATTAAGPGARRQITRLKQQERKGILRRQTRRIGQFEYVVTLPGDIDPNKVDATLHEGVLTVRLGKEAASQPRRIEIKD
jgi:HSP20 family protein